METGLTLTGDMILVLIVLSATIGLFVSELVRVDIAAILVMVTIGLLGLVPAGDLFNGFASNAVLSIIAVMILGAGTSSVTESMACRRPGSPTVANSRPPRSNQVTWVSLAWLFR